MSRNISQWTEGDKCYVLQEYPAGPGVAEVASANDNGGSSEEEPSDFWSWAKRGSDGEILPIPDADLPDKWRWVPKKGQRNRRGVPDLHFGLFVSIPCEDLVARSEEIRKASADKSFRPTYDILLEHALSRFREDTYIKPMVLPLCPYHWPDGKGKQDWGMQVLAFYYNDEDQGIRAWFEGDRLEVLVNALKRGFGLPDDAQPMWYLVAG